MPISHAALFSDESRAALTFIAQTGVILFMFVVGTRLELDTFRRHSRAVVAIAAAGIVVPFVLGAGLGRLLFDAFADPSIPRCRSSFSRDGDERDRVSGAREDHR